MARRGGITVRVDGLRRLQARLEDLPDELNDACKTAIKDGAEEVRGEVERTVPVDTGYLKRSVRVRYTDGGLTARVGWFAKQAYYAKFVEHGTSSQPAQPTLGPALEQERPKLPDRVRDEVRRVIEG